MDTKQLASIAAKAGRARAEGTGNFVKKGTAANTLAVGMMLVRSLNKTQQWEFVFKSDKNVGLYAKSTTGKANMQWYSGRVGEDSTLNVTGLSTAEIKSAGDPTEEDYLNALIWIIQRDQQTLAWAEENEEKPDPLVLPRARFQLDQLPKNAAEVAAEYEVVLSDYGIE